MAASRRAMPMSSYISSRGLGKLHALHQVSADGVERDCRARWRGRVRSDCYCYRKCKDQPVEQREGCQPKHIRYLKEKGRPGGRPVNLEIPIFVREHRRSLCYDPFAVIGGG